LHENLAGKVHFDLLNPRRVIIVAIGTCGIGVVLEGDAARAVRRPSDSIVEPPPGLPGYEGTRAPILEDDDPGGAA
jgi:hypothetical protein